MYLQPELKMLRIEIKLIYSKVPDTKNTNTANKYHQTNKDFRKKIKEEAENQFIGESDRMLKNDVVTYMLDKLKLSLPDQFLKHWLLKTSEKPLTVELIDKEYDMYSKSLKANWFSSPEFGEPV